MMMMAKQYFRFSFTPSLFLSLSVSPCKRLCRSDCAGENASVLDFSSDALEYLSTRVKRCETRNETTREAFHAMSTKRAKDTFTTQSGKQTTNTTTDTRRCDGRCILDVFQTGVRVRLIRGDGRMDVGESPARAIPSKSFD